MFDVDRSAARGLMSAQKLIIFKHNSVLGNAPANKLFELVKVEMKKEKEGKAPSSIEDYNITSIEEIRKGLENIYEQIEVEELI